MLVHPYAHFRRRGQCLIEKHRRATPRGAQPSTHFAHLCANSSHPCSLPQTVHPHSGSHQRRCSPLGNLKRTPTAREALKPLNLPNGVGLRKGGGVRACSPSLSSCSMHLLADLCLWTESHSLLALPSGWSKNELTDSMMCTC